jgi:hypothetical protein
MVYDTLSVSPETTFLSPGAVKSDAENNVPTAPLLALPLVKKHPPTVDVALMENAAGEAVFVTTEGLAVVAVTKVGVTRVALLYGTTSVHPAWDAIVSPAAGLLLAAAPYRPIYQVVI